MATVAIWDFNIANESLIICGHYEWMAILI